MMSKYNNTKAENEMMTKSMEIEFARIQSPYQMTNLKRLY